MENLNKTRFIFIDLYRWDGENLECVQPEIFHHLVQKLGSAGWFIFARLFFTMLVIVCARLVASAIAVVTTNKIILFKQN